MDNLDFPLLLKEVRPYADTIAYIPLTQAEIDAVERLTGHTLPAFYREYLGTFGLLQDFVVGLLEKPYEFETYREYLPKHLWSDYIVIGHNGGEDCWLLPAKATASDNQLYECQHWNGYEIVPLGFSFTELLFRSIPSAASQSHSVPNDQKAWKVQVAVHSKDYQKLLTTLQGKLLTDWVRTGTSSAGVTTFSAEIYLPFGNRTLSRLEYKEWSTPLLFFDMEDPFAQLQRGISTIRPVDQALQAAFGDAHKLVDYGIMPINLDG
jgi:hypothetical protein